MAGHQQKAGEIRQKQQNAQNPYHEQGLGEGKKKRGHHRGAKINNEPGI